MNMFDHTPHYKVVLKPGTFGLKYKGVKPNGLDLEQALVDFVLAKGLATNPLGDCCTLIPFGGVDEESLDFLGKGFISGGGSGQIPGGTIATITGGDHTFSLKFSDNSSALDLTDDSLFLYGPGGDNFLEMPSSGGLQFTSDGGTFILNNNSHQLTFTSNGDFALYRADIDFQVNISLNNVTENYTLYLPSNDGDAGQVLQTDGNGVLSWNTLVNPRPYNIYTALITQTGISDPVVTVFENTIGPILWKRDGAGIYSGTLIGIFLQNKTWLLATSSDSNIGDGGGNGNLINILRLSDDAIGLVTTDATDGLSYFPIEIRVYL